MRLRIACAVVALAMASGASVVVAPAAVAAPTCENRGAGHRDRHGGIEDDRYHLARGERVTCDKGSGKDSTRELERKPAPEQKSDKSDDKKSRYCRKRWYC